MQKVAVIAVIVFGLASCVKPPPRAIIPDERLAPWAGNVGVPGGIQLRQTIYKTLTPSGGDDAPAILSAMKACPAGQVVLLSAGTFIVAQTMTFFGGPDSDNKTLRGAGMGKTIIRATGAASPFYLRGISAWPVISSGPTITAGATKGSTTLTVGDTSSFTAGQIIHVAPATPSYGHNLNNFPDTIRNMGGDFRLVSKTATTLTIEPPMPFDYSAMTPQVFQNGSTTLTGASLESFTVDMSATQADSVVKSERTWGCWFYDLEFHHPYTRYTILAQSVRCQWNRCYFHDASTGPNHEGLDFGTSSWNLVEDCIFENAGSMGVIFGDGTGKGFCNVIAYNFFTKTPPAWWDISVNHGPHNMLNLIEGNVCHWYKDDGYFGSSSHQTLFRNRIDWQIALKHFSTYYTVIGNIIGTAGVNTVYESSKAGVYESSIYELGYPNIGNNSYSGTFGPTDPPNYTSLPNTLDGTQQCDLNVKATLIRHGNWDSVNNAVIWDSSIADHNIPKSLYLTDAPSWWDNSLRWPPIGPDLSPMIGKIPAQVRYETKGSPTPAPTASATGTPAPATPTPTITPPVTPTRTPTPAPTSTPTATAIPSVTPVPTPSPQPTPSPVSPSPTITPGAQFSAWAYGERDKGYRYAYVNWSGSTATTYDVFRDNKKIATVLGFDFTDSLGKGGNQTFIYKVCEQGTQKCSNEAATNF